MQSATDGIVPVFRLSRRPCKLLTFRRKIFGAECRALRVGGLFFASEITMDIRWHEPTVEKPIEKDVKIGGMSLGRWLAIVAVLGILCTLALPAQSEPSHAETSSNSSAAKGKEPVQQKNCGLTASNDQTTEELKLRHSLMKKVTPLADLYNAVSLSDLRKVGFTDQGLTFLFSEDRSTLCAHLIASPMLSFVGFQSSW